jgi:hypothetical protein
MLSITEKEVDEVLTRMKVDTTPSPDGLPMIFFKCFKALTKPYIMGILNGYALGRVDVARLNLEILTLIPKIQGQIVSTNLEQSLLLMFFLNLLLRPMLLGFLRWPTAPLAELNDVY